jgi:glycosyltransferase involved in cell wall biosynthesis
MVKITVVMTTRRERPHFEWYLDSLINQTFKDFECIFVDGLYDQRKDEISKLIDNIVNDNNNNKGNKFPVLHLKDKASRWKNRRPALCNARNTGLIFANGKYIVHADDNCKMPPNWLEEHYEWLSKGYLVTGSWKTVRNNKDKYESRHSMISEPKVLDYLPYGGGGWLYGANMGFPLSAALDVNGFDEYLDGEMGQDDVDFGIRAVRKGYNIVYNPRCCVEYVTVDHGHLMVLGEGSDHPKGHSDFRNFVGFKLTPIRRVLKDGKEHHSNELATQDLLDDEKRFWTRGNIIQIKGTREMFGTGNGFDKWKYNIEEMYKVMEDCIDKNRHDWRDEKLISDKIKGTVQGIRTL